MKNNAIIYLAKRAMLAKYEVIKMTVKATEIKNRLGQYLRMSISSPVFIEKNRSTVAVLLSSEEYDRLLKLENTYWAEKAAQAEAGGYIGKKASMKFIQAAGHAKA